MVKDDLDKLHKSLPEGMRQNMNNPLWKQAFQEYNEAPENKSRPLGMGCRPCYAKVYYFLLKKETVKTIQTPTV